jgi:hypothetical protein
LNPFSVLWKVRSVLLLTFFSLSSTWHSWTLFWWESMQSYPLFTYLSGWKWTSLLRLVTLLIRVLCIYWIKGKVPGQKRKEISKLELAFLFGVNNCNPFKQLFFGGVLIEWSRK